MEQLDKGNEKRKKQFLSITKTIKSAFVIALGVLDGETKTIQVCSKCLRAGKVTRA